MGLDAVGGLEDSDDELRDQVQDELRDLDLNLLHVLVVLEQFGVHFEELLVPLTLDKPLLPLDLLGFMLFVLQEVLEDVQAVEGFVRVINVQNLVVSGGQKLFVEGGADWHLLQHLPTGFGNRFILLQQIEQSVVEGFDLGELVPGKGIQLEDI